MTGVSIALEIDYFVLSSYTKISFTESNITATSSQTVLSSEETINLSLMLLNILQTISYYPDIFTLNINSLLNHLNTVTNIGLTLLESERAVSNTFFNVKTCKTTTNQLQNSNIDLLFASIHFPSSLNLNSTEISFIASHSFTNPFDSSDTILQQFIIMEIQNLSNNEPLNIKNLNEPLLLNFNVTRKELKNIDNKISNNTGINTKFWPKCTFWLFNTSE